MKEFEIANDQYEARVILEEILRPIDYEVKLPSKKKSKKYSKKILFVSKIIKTSGDIGKGMLQITSSAKTFNDAAPTGSLKLGFNIGTLVFAALDFILIPAFYLACFVLDGKAPINRANNARWLFSAVLLALTITAICIPAVAVAIAFTSASISLALGIFLLGNAIHERFQLGKERRALRKLMVRAELEMENIQGDALLLMEDLKKGTTEQQLITLSSQVEFLADAYYKQQEYLIKLKIKESRLNKKINNAGLVPLLDKGIGLSLSTLGMIGLIVSLYFPMAGLGILTAVSVISLVYLVVRFAFPLVQSFGKWVLGKFRAEVSENTSKDELKQNLTPDKTPSTDSMLTSFFGSKQNAIDHLKKAPQENVDFSLMSTAALFQTGNEIHHANQPLIQHELFL